MSQIVLSLHCRPQSIIKNVPFDRDKIERFRGRGNAAAVEEMSDDDDGDEMPRRRFHKEEICAFAAPARAQETTTAAAGDFRGHKREELRRRTPTERVECAPTERIIFFSFSFVVFFFLFFFSFVFS